MFKQKKLIKLESESEESCFKFLFIFYNFFYRTKYNKAVGYVLYTPCISKKCKSNKFWARNLNEFSFWGLKRFWFGKWKIWKIWIKYHFITRILYPQNGLTRVSKLVFIKIFCLKFWALGGRAVFFKKDQQFLWLKEGVAPEGVWVPQESLNMVKPSSPPPLDKSSPLPRQLMKVLISFGTQLCLENKIYH